MWSTYSDRLEWGEWLDTILECEKDIARLFNMMEVISVDVTYEWSVPTRVVVYRMGRATTWLGIDSRWEEDNVERIL